jgi:hypothetical protein
MAASGRSLDATGAVHSVPACRAATKLFRKKDNPMDFEQAKKVLQLTDTRIRKFGSIDISTTREIHQAIFRFQPFQRLVLPTTPKKL